MLSGILSLNSSQNVRFQSEDCKSKVKYFELDM